MKMNYFLFLGFERWGNLRPTKKWNPLGKCYVPLCCSIWIRNPFHDKKFKEVTFPII
jgi:hypothetical protein